MTVVAADIHHSVGEAKGASTFSMFLVLWSYVLKYETSSFTSTAPCNGLQGSVAEYAANQTRNTLGRAPFYF